MNVRKYLKWMVLLALVVPPALLFIDFKSSKELQLMPQTEEEYFQNEEDLLDSDYNYDDSSDDSSGGSRSSSDDESPEPMLASVNTDRDDDQTNDEMAHESNTLRKRRRKSRKKRRKKQNSSTFHPEEPSTSPNNANANRTDEINLRVLNETPINHQSSSPTTGTTTISIDDKDEIDHTHEMIFNVDAPRPRRNCCRTVSENFHQSAIFRFLALVLRQSRKLLRRYRCCRRVERDHDSLDSADQISFAKKIYEFYNAPVTKFFQDLIFYIIFLAIFTYVILIRTPPKPSVCEWLLMSYLSTVALDLIRELLMMNETRWKTWLSVYFHDVLHLYDTFCCLMFAIAFALRVTSAFQIVGRLLLCINLSLWYLRMFHFLVVSKEVGPYIHIAARNIIDLLRLIVIVLIVLMSFGVSRQAIKYPNKDWDWHSVKHIFLEPYFMIYGEVYADIIDPPCNRTENPDTPQCQFGHFITPITMTAFLLVCNILLLSMLMAQFTSTFMRLSRLSDQVWKFQRYHTILQYEQKPLLAPPLIIFAHIFLLIKTFYRICRHRKRTFNRGLKLFLSAKEIEKLRDFEEECVHEYLLAKEDKEKSTVEERMSSTSEKVSNMLLRVETLKRNGMQQTTYFQNFDERLQRLEEMQASTVQLLSALVQNLQTSSQLQAPSIETDSMKSNEKSHVNDQDNDEPLHFSAIPTPDDLSLPMSSLLSSGGARTIRSSSFTGRKGANATGIIPTSAPPQIIISGYTDTLSIKGIGPSALPGADERLGISAATLGSSSSLNTAEDSSHQNLSKAEETEHNIYGKLIKERFRKLSEVVEDIERTLPSHHQRQDSKHEKCDITDDDETLSTLDWVDTTTRVTFNSTRVSRFDVNQDEMGPNVITAVADELVHEGENTLISDVLIHPSDNEESKSS